jgi:TM2 domain-containing membrane protein YozV
VSSGPATPPEFNSAPTQLNRGLDSSQTAMKEPGDRGRQFTDPGTSKLSGSSLGQDFANPGTSKLGTGSAANLDPLNPRTTNLGSGSRERVTLDPNTSKLGGSSGTDYLASASTPSSSFGPPDTPSGSFGRHSSSSRPSDPFGRLGTSAEPSDSFGSPYASHDSTDTPASPYASPGNPSTPANPYANPSAQASPYASPGTPGSPYADQGAPSTPYPYPGPGSPSTPGSPYAGPANQGAPYPSANSPYSPGGAFGGASPYSPYGGPASPYGSFPQKASGTSGFAIASLVLGIFGIFAITAILSLVFGFLGLAKIRRTGQRGKGLAIAGIVLSGAWIILLIALGISSGNQAQRSANGQINKGGNLSVLSLKSGDCFAYPTDQQEVNTVTAIPCSQAHDAQVFAQFNLSGTSSNYPTNMIQLASNGCQARTASLNKSLRTPSMSMKIVYPQNASWITGNRTVNCVIYSPTNLNTSLLNS